MPRLVQNKYSKISAYCRFHPVILGLIILLPVLIAPAWSNEPKPFEEFHSNLGEVLILPLYARPKPPLKDSTVEEREVMIAEFKEANKAKHQEIKEKTKAVKEEIRAQVETEATRTSDQ